MVDLDILLVIEVGHMYMANFLIAVLLSNWAGHESIWDHFDEQHASSGDGADSVAA